MWPAAPTSDTGFRADISTVALSLISTEIGEPLENLAERLGDDVTIDSAIGIRVISTALARHVIGVHRAEQRQARMRAEQIEAARARDLAQAGQITQQLRQRIEARRQREQAMRATGEIADDAPALAVVAATDHESRMARAGHRWDEMMAANRAGLAGTGAMLSPGKEG